MKKSPAVLQAEALVAQREQEMNAAESALKAAQVAWRDAIGAANEARIAADAHLPSCTIVWIRAFDGRTTRKARAVIVRQTAGGQLVARIPGVEAEYRFKFNRWTNEFRQAEARNRIADCRVLQDVPQQYLPANESAKA